MKASKNIFQKAVIIITFFIVALGFSQEKNYSETELNIESSPVNINGTLLLPKGIKNPKLLILIPGSGPTDRNGNQGQIQSNATKFLAEALSGKGIATYRFDKNVISLSKQKDFKEESVLFDAYITNANTIITYFKNKKVYSKIIIAGHSQGSLVAMLVANKTDAYISLDGAGRAIDEVVLEQISKQAPYLVSDSRRVFESFKKGEKVKDIPQMLASLFRPSVQPFMINWLQYVPEREIKKVIVPILIVNGTKDIQVPELDAQLLHKANPKSRLEIILNMNHIFKEIEGDITENMQSYAKPNLPVMPELVEILVDFIKKI